MREVPRCNNWGKLDTFCTDEIFATDEIDFPMVIKMFQ